MPLTFVSGHLDKRRQLLDIDRALPRRLQMEKPENDTGRGRLLVGGFGKVHQIHQLGRKCQHHARSPFDPNIVAGLCIRVKTDQLEQARFSAALHLLNPCHAVFVLDHARAPISSAGMPSRVCRA